MSTPQEAEPETAAGKLCWRAYTAKDAYGAIVTGFYRARSNEAVKRWLGRRGVYTDIEVTAPLTVPSCTVFVPVASVSAPVDPLRHSKPLQSCLHECRFAFTRNKANTSPTHWVLTEQQLTQLSAEVGKSAEHVEGLVQRATYAGLQFKIVKPEDGMHTPACAVLADWRVPGGAHVQYEPTTVVQMQPRTEEHAKQFSTAFGIPESAAGAWKADGFMPEAEETAHYAEENAPRCSTCAPLLAAPQEESKPSPEQSAKESAKVKLFKALEARALVNTMPPKDWAERYPEFAYQVQQEQRYGAGADYGEALHRALTVLIAEALVICL